VWCGYDVSAVEATKIVKRQVFDIPEPRLVVTEHRVIVKDCPACKAELKGNFPVEIKAPVQYGERIKAVGMYLHHQHSIPEDRLKQVLGDLCNCPMATGTITKITKILGSNSIVVVV